VASRGAIGYATALSTVGRELESLAALGAVHRAAYAGWADRLTQTRVRRAFHGAGHQLATEYIRRRVATPQTASFYERPDRLLGTRMLVLKGYRPDERGVLLIDYTEMFSLVARLFDIQAIANRFRLVLEPGWSGYFDLDLLCATVLPEKVYIEAFEPRDRAFLATLGLSLVPVPISTNWWVDHRVFRPLSDVSKEADLIMIASWARFKRHAQFFAAVARARRLGRRLRVILVGYPNGMTKDDIARLASYYGILDQLEVFEWLSATEVNHQLNRARVNVIWSRREGVNRAIIEGMFAGTPCIVREGFNYGYPYPYVNRDTGRFASESTLPDTIVDMLDQGCPDPRAWVLANMSCQKATAILNDAIRSDAEASGEAWTQDLVVKVSQLNAMDYWDPLDRPRFTEDYEFLRSTIRPSIA